MKHLFCVLALVAFFIIGYTQTKIAVKGGWNYNTARIYDNDIKQPNEYKSGFGLAVLFKVPFENLLHFSPYIAYNQRGFAYKPLTGFVSKYENTIHYIDLVPALSIDLPVKDNTIVLSAGIGLGFAISGKEKISAGESTVTRKMKFSTQGDFSLIDLGMSSSISYHFKKFFIETGFLLGLANINNNIDNRTSPGVFTDPRNIRNRTISLNVGYYIK